MRYWRNSSVACERCRLGGALPPLVETWDDETKKTEAFCRFCGRRDLRVPILLGEHWHRFPQQPEPPEMCGGAGDEECREAYRSMPEGTSPQPVTVLIDGEPSHQRGVPSVGWP